MSKKTPSTAINNQVSNVKALFTDILPPKEAGELNEEELEMFWLLLKAKGPTDWLETELYTLACQAKRNIKLMEYEKKLVDQGPTLINARGTEIMNPMFNVVDTMVRQQMSVYRSIGLTASGQDTAGIKKRAHEQKEKSEKTSKVKQNLLAKPA